MNDVAQRDVLSPEELQDVLRVYRGAPDDGELLGPFECIVAHDAALREQVARLQKELNRARFVGQFLARNGLPDGESSAEWLAARAEACSWEAPLPKLGETPSP